MGTDLPLPPDKKLTILFRVEPGCLGPDGSKHIEAFCLFAQQKIAALATNFIHWQIVPRHDKSLAEVQYKILNKNLTYDQATRYLEKLSKNLDEIEELFHEVLVLLIGQFLRK